MLMKLILGLCFIHCCFCLVSYQPEQIHISYGEGPSEIVVTWNTKDDTGSSVVEYGIGGLILREVGNSTLFVGGGEVKKQQYVHRVKLTNLSPSSKYVYHCGSDKGWSDMFWFLTTPFHSSWSPQLAIYGDLGNENAQSLPRLQEETQRGMYDAIIHVGDFAYDMNTENGEVGDEFMRQIQSIAAYLPYMTCPGNHEEAYNFSDYRARFSMPGNTEGLWYSFNMGPIHFISVSTEVYYFLDYGLKLLIKQYNWLEKDLKEATSPENRTERPWIIIYGHRPMYCSNANTDDCTNYETWTRVGVPFLNWFGMEKLLYDYGVDLAIWAHEHSYERMWPMYNYKVLNGSYEDPYRNPHAPVHITTGSAGCKEEHDLFTEEQPYWSAFRSIDYGYMRMRVFNRTHLYAEQVSVEKVAFLEWIRFNFFDLIKDVDGGKIAESLKDAKVNAATSGNGYLVFGDTEGNIHLVSRSFQVTTFRAYKVNVSLAEQLRHITLLVTIGEDEPVLNPVIKVWNLDNLGKNGHPKCIRMSRATPGHKPVEATALSVHENLNYMAVGFADGSIVLYKGEMTKEQTNKIKVLRNGNSMVTGLAFHSVSSYINLFVATESNIYLYNITVKDKEERFHLDDMGCAKRCSVLAESVQESHFMIGKNDAIYCYTPNGRGPCYAMEGWKIMLQWFCNYLVIVTKNRKSVTNVTSHESTPANDRDLEMHMVTVLDIQNKLIVFSTLLQELQAVLTEWGTFYILGGDNKLYHLQEKDLQSKLALLLKKNLYDISVRIARSQHYHSEGLIDIFRQYGDYLYTKGDHSAAIEQYIRTIGKLESSYIIRKYLDSQHIDILITYLQALHKHGLATEDHTTLLLNCYIKQNDTEKLKEFVMTKDCELDFDIEIAIRVCRQASAEVALLLARKHGMHDWYLKIEIEDRGKYREALEYISSLELTDAEGNMKKYGNVLIKHVPDEVTQFLKMLCTDYRPNNKPLVNQCALDKHCASVVAGANPEDFICLFLSNSKRLIEFLEHLIKVKSKCSNVIYNTLIEHYLHVWASEKDPLSKKLYEQKVMLLLENSEAGFDKDQFFILCQIYNFKSGILHLYEESKLYQQIVQYHIKQQEYKSALASYRCFGHQDPNLWVHALWMCAKDPNMPSSFLAEVLTEVEKKQLLSPLLVIDVLSTSSSVTLGEIHNYLLSVLLSENELIKKEQELIDKYRQESERAHILIETIQTSTITFQGSRCSACHRQLELPSVHFLCHHCYHQHCFQSFAEKRNECLACFPENKKLLNMIKAQEHRENLHETFHSQLEKAEDSFSLVAEYFGHGVFNKLIIITDSSLSESITRDSSAGERTCNVPAYEPNTGEQVKSIETTAPGITERQVTVEDRLRLEKSHDVNSYSSLEANVTRGKSESSASRASLSSALDSPVSVLQQPKEIHNSSLFAQAIVCRSKQQVRTPNLFEEEYDKSKNPFAENDTTNPFAENDDEEDEDDYDKNLNPFAE